MKRVAFIGNSHLAALKQGLGLLEEDLSFEPLFFGSAAGSLRDLTVSGTRLKSGQRRLSKKLIELWGVDEFDLSEVDLVCLVGLGLSIRLLRQLHNVCRADHHQEPSLSQQLVTAATFDLATKGLLATTALFDVAELVKQATDAAIVILFQPAPSVEVLDRRQGEWMRNLLASGDGVALLDAMTRALKEKIPGVLVVPQPPATMANAICTAADYMVGSVGFREAAHEDGDATHANPAYGAAVLKSLDVDRLIVEASCLRQQAASQDRFLVSA